MKKVLITGANGMLGRDLSGLLAENDFQVIETDIHNMDITKITDVNAFIGEQKPDYIVHAAAYTDVDGAETRRDAAFLINEKGAENIAKMNVPMFYISTDYVFDGTKTSPYTTADVPNPVNTYGKTKLAGEIAIKKNNSRHYILRTSWLYGHKGKNFVETMINLASKHNELRVVDDQQGCPTGTIELSRAILLFLKEQKPFGTYHVCGSGSTTWFGFAKKIMEYMDIDIAVKPVTTGEFPRPARRPVYSVMDNNGLCPDWELSLVEYLRLRIYTKMS